MDTPSSTRDEDKKKQEEEEEKYELYYWENIKKDVPSASVPPDSHPVPSGHTPIPNDPSYVKKASPTHNQFDRSEATIPHPQPYHQPLPPAHDQGGVSMHKPPFESCIRMSSPPHLNSYLPPPNPRHAQLGGIAPQDNMGRRLSPDPRRERDPRHDPSYDPRSISCDTSIPPLQPYSNKLSPDPYSAPRSNVHHLSRPDRYSAPQSDVIPPRPDLYSGPQSNFHRPPRPDSYSGPPSNVRSDPYSGPNSNIIPSRPDSRSGSYSDVRSDPYSGPHSDVRSNPYSGSNVRSDPYSDPPNFNTISPRPDPHSDPHSNVRSDPYSAPHSNVRSDPYSDPYSNVHHERSDPHSAPHSNVMIPPGSDSYSETLSIVHHPPRPDPHFGPRSNAHHPTRSDPYSSHAIPSRSDSHSNAPIQQFNNPTTSGYTIPKTSHTNSPTPPPSRVMTTSTNESNNDKQQSTRLVDPRKKYSQFKIKSKLSTSETDKPSSSSDPLPELLRDSSVLTKPIAPKDLFAMPYSSSVGGTSGGGISIFGSGSQQQGDNENAHEYGEIKLRRDSSTQDAAVDKVTDSTSEEGGEAPVIIPSYMTHLHLGISQDEEDDSLKIDSAFGSLQNRKRRLSELTSASGNSNTGTATGITDTV